MTIYTMCVDPERGAYMAISAEDSSLKVVCGTSEEEALGRLVAQTPGIVIDKVISVDTTGGHTKERTA